MVRSVEHQKRVGLLLSDMRNGEDNLHLRTYRKFPKAEALFEEVAQIFETGKMANWEVASIFHLMASTYRFNRNYQDDERMLFKDASIDLIQGWMEHDFRPHSFMDSRSVKNFYTCFHFLNLRPPESFRHYLEQQFEKIPFVSANDAMRVLNYYADIPDPIPVPLYKMTAKSVRNGCAEMVLHGCADVISDLASLDSRQPELQGLHDLSPKSIYRAVVDLTRIFARMNDLPYEKKRAYLNNVVDAKYWFSDDLEEKVSIGSNKRNYMMDEMSGALSDVGIKLCSEFNVQSLGSFPYQACEVGGVPVVVTSDTRKRFYVDMDDSLAIRYRGGLLLESAILEKMNPDLRILRLSTTVLNRFSSAAVGDAVQRVAACDAGVFGVDLQGVVMPVRDLKIHI